MSSLFSAFFPVFTAIFYKALDGHLLEVSINSQIVIALFAAFEILRTLLFFSYSILQK